MPHGGRSPLAPTTEWGRLAASPVQPFRRVLLAAASVVALVALMLAEGAPGASQSALVASTSTCPGSASYQATEAEQRAALLCLINYARAQAGLTRVRSSYTLSWVAHAKGRDVVACSDFGHNACGKAAFAHVRESGFPYRLLGENLFAAQRPVGTARDALVAWLNSPSHREVLFLPGFSDAGIALFRLRRLADTPRMRLWVLELAERA